jgi:hypothetical protein
VEEEQSDTSATLHQAGLSYHPVWLNSVFRLDPFQTLAVGLSCVFQVFAEPERELAIRYLFGFPIKSQKKLANADRSTTTTDVIPMAGCLPFRYPGAQNSLSRGLANALPFSFFGNAKKLIKKTIRAGRPMTPPKIEKLSSFG